MPTSTPPDRPTPDSSSPQGPTTPNPSPSQGKSPEGWEGETPGFQPPPQSPTREPDPLGADTQTRELLEDEIAYDVSPPGSSGPSSTGRTTTTGLFPGSTASAKTFEPVIGTAFGVATMLVDLRLTPETHAWQPTEVETKRIVEPLARIAARHTPVVGGQEANDVMDVLDAGLAVVGYGLRARQDAILHAQAELQAQQNRPQQ